MIGNNPEMPYRPSDNYTSNQNPPDFSWPYESDNASYDLIICSDKDLKSVIYIKENITTNFYNFSYVFDPGIYFWSVRCNKGNWCTPRRFLLTRDAYHFPVEDIDTLISRIDVRHPRIYTNTEDLPCLRKRLLSKENLYFPVLKQMVEGFKSQSFPKEESCNPLPSNSESMYGSFQYAADNTKLACNMAMLSAFYYMITGDRETGTFAVENLVKLSKWSAGGCTGYHLNDQAHRRIALNSALAYDWLYDILTEEQKTAVLDMINERTSIMFKSSSFNISHIAANPFDSHGWTAIGYVCLIALAVYKDLDEAKTWIRYSLPLYINRMHPWSNEDGGWAQGTYYWAVSSYFAKKLSEGLLSSNVIDLYKKAWQQNEYKYPLYFHPEGSIGAFGDNSYLKPSAKDLTAISTLTERAGRPELKWLRQQWKYLRTYNHADDPDPSTCMFDRLFSDEEAFLPVDIPSDIYMKDIGWTAMHSDIYDPLRTSLFFKSSCYGSFNHSHADQNSFIIQAFGQPLAIDSGYYDLYGYPFDVNYTRQTFAHNAITHSNGKGQPIFDLSAKGSIIDFLPGKRFSLTGGDSTPSYKGTLDKAVRHIIFIKPDKFLVIDDLKAPEGERTTFEFWLNVQKDIQISGKRAEVFMDTASLDMEVLYPENISIYKSDVFSGTDMIPRLPIYAGHERWPVQKRLWVQTDNVSDTKIITFLAARQSGRVTIECPVERRDNCIIYTPVSDTNVYINVDGFGKIKTDRVDFTGVAAITGPDCFMLVNGTSLYINGTKIVESSSEISISFDKDKLYISSLLKDTKVTVMLNGNTVIDEKNSASGILAQKHGSYTDFHLYRGTYEISIYKKCPARTRKLTLL